jgi:UDP-N-acetylglucosamine acyltransferase
VGTGELDMSLHRLGSKNFVHQTAIIDDNVTAGEGNYIGPFCYLTGNLEIGNNNRFESHCTVGTRAEHTEHWHKDGRVIIGDDGTFRDHVSIHAATADGLTRIGNCVIILNKAYVAHDCVLEDGSILSCGVKIGGNVHVMRDSNLGMGASVHQYQVIGSWSMIGMGSIIPKKTRLEPGQTWVGNPARRLKTNMYALDKHDIDDYMLVEETARYGELVKLHGL